MSEKYYSVKVAAQELRVGEHVLKKTIKDKELNASEVPASGRRGFKYMIPETELIQWYENRKARITIIPNVTQLTVDDIANDILNRVKRAYDEGFRDGAKHAKEVLQGAIKEAKI